MNNLSFIVTLLALSPTANIVEGSFASCKAFKEFWNQEIEKKINCVDYSGKMALRQINNKPVNFKKTINHN